MSRLLPGKKRSSFQASFNQPIRFNQLWTQFYNFTTFQTCLEDKSGFAYEWWACFLFSLFFVCKNINLSEPNMRLQQLQLVKSRGYPWTHTPSGHWGTIITQRGNFTFHGNILGRVGRNNYGIKKLLHLTIALWQTWNSIYIQFQL